MASPFWLFLGGYLISIRSFFSSLLFLSLFSNLVFSTPIPMSLSNPGSSPLPTPAPISTSNRLEIPGANHEKKENLVVPSLLCRGFLIRISDDGELARDTENWTLEVYRTGDKNPTNLIPCRHNLCQPFTLNLTSFPAGSSIGFCSRLTGECPDGFEIFDGDNCHRDGNSGGGSRSSSDLGGSSRSRIESGYRSDGIMTTSTSNPVVSSSPSPSVSSSSPNSEDNSNAPVTVFSTTTVDLTTTSIVTLTALAPTSSSESLTSPTPISTSTSIGTSSSSSMRSMSMDTSDGMMMASPGSDDDGLSNGKTTPGVIVGIVLASLAFFFFILATIYLSSRRRRRAQGKDSDSRDSGNLTSSNLTNFRGKTKPRGNYQATANRDVDIDVEADGYKETTRPPHYDSSHGHLSPNSASSPQSGGLFGLKRLLHSGSCWVFSSRDYQSVLNKEEDQDGGGKEKEGLRYNGTGVITVSNSRGSSSLKRHEAVKKNSKKGKQKDLSWPSPIHSGFDLQGRKDSSFSPTLDTPMNSENLQPDKRVHFEEEGIEVEFVQPKSPLPLVSNGGSNPFLAGRRRSLSDGDIGTSSFYVPYSQRQHQDQQQVSNFNLPSSRSGRQGRSKTDGGFLSPKSIGDYSFFSHFKSRSHSDVDSASSRGNKYKFPTSNVRSPSSTSSSSTSPIPKRYPYLSPTLPPSLPFSSLPSTTSNSKSHATTIWSKPYPPLPQTLTIDGKRTKGKDEGWGEMFDGNEHPYKYREITFEVTKVCGEDEDDHEKERSRNPAGVNEFGQPTESTPTFIKSGAPQTRLPTHLNHSYAFPNSKPISTPPQPLPNITSPLSKGYGHVKSDSSTSSHSHSTAYSEPFIVAAPGQRMSPTGPPSPYPLSPSYCQSLPNSNPTAEVSLIALGNDGNRNSQKDWDGIELNPGLRLGYAKPARSMGTFVEKLVINHDGEEEENHNNPFRDSDSAIQAPPSPYREGSKPPHSISTSPAESPTDPFRSRSPQHRIQSQSSSSSPPSSSFSQRSLERHSLLVPPEQNRHRRQYLNQDRPRFSGSTTTTTTTNPYSLSSECDWHDEELSSPLQNFPAPPDRIDTRDGNPFRDDIRREAEMHHDDDDDGDWEPTGEVGIEDGIPIVPVSPPLIPEIKGVELDLSDLI